MRWHTRKLLKMAAIALIVMTVTFFIGIININMYLATKPL